MKLFAVQKPGQPDAGPITPALRALAAANAHGRPIAPIGAELAQLIDRRGVRVSFVPTGGAGVAPWRGHILLPQDYLNAGQTAAPWKICTVAHELIHVLQRDLRDPRYWPDGGRPTAAKLFGPLPAPVGESTNYMEVLAYLVGKTVEYDLRRHTNPNDPALPGLQNALATYTADPPNAIRYMLKTSPTEVYRGNYVKELKISGHRIPDGGWVYWLKRLGFGEQSLQHIRDSAAGGVVESVPAEAIDPRTGIYT